MIESRAAADLMLDRRWLANVTTPRRRPAEGSMSAADLLRAAADVLLRTSCTTWTGEHARALADVLVHEAGWAETDPNYARRPEPLPIAAARVVLGSAPRRPGATGWRNGPTTTSTTSTSPCAPTTQPRH